ncbi:F-box/FBD/LRR-repeat protein At1g13570-like [Punica granatum]|uniref:F-box/FBD/LRR-repeat protein At1g13570-like n=1 Tax=Punica granatum TaxID=22663 RepID=A0A6P8D143_PUNGR|nr:F-box/FBD/LRR-repeat protein At1g13570-like [Punica granatum]
MEKAVDRISDLPTHLMDQILVRLPIKEAVRTSILSTKWRYKWASIPELVFHNDLECHPIDGRRLVDIVDHVLRSHVGPTVKFEACHEDVYDSRTINRLRKLDSLELTSVSLTQDDIELLISSSPRLTKLRLHHLIDDVECLNISAPNLKVIDIWSSYQDINFQTPNCLFSVACFSEGHIPEKLPQPCTQLKYLSFAIDFGSPKEILTAFCLLRSCPNLEEVEFKEEYGSRKPFEQVKFLPFSNTGGLEAEIGLMKFLLVNSPGLKRIKVQVSYYERVREVYLEKLVELPRASPQVRIIYEHDSLKFDQEFDDEILPEVA